MKYLILAFALSLTPVQAQDIEYFEEQMPKFKWVMITNRNGVKIPAICNQWGAIQPSMQNCWVMPRPMHNEWMKWAAKGRRFNPPDHAH